MQVGIDVVDGSAVETDRGEQTAVFRDPVQVRAHMAIVEENAAPGIAAFDASVEVIPLVHPANGRRRSIAGGPDLLLLCDQFKNAKHAVEFAPVRAAGEHPIAVALRGKLRQ